MAINNIKIVEVLLPGIRGSGGAVEFWSNTESNYEVNDKVSYLSGIFNAHTSPIPVGTLPTDVDYWTNITASGGGGGGLPLGGDVNDILIKQSSIDEDAIWQRSAVGKYNTGIEDYKSGDWVTDNSNLYVCILDNPPLGTLITDTTYWQNNTDKVLLDTPVTFWDVTAADYTLNSKVSYLDKLYNSKEVIVPAGTLPTDTNFWEVLGGDFNPNITDLKELDAIVADSDLNFINRRLLDSDIKYEFRGGSPRYEIIEDQLGFNLQVARSGGGTYLLDNTDVSLYEPVFSSRLNQNGLFTYTELGDVISVNGGNVNGSFHVELSSFGSSVSTGDAIYISNTPVTDIAPEDNSDTFIVVSTDNSSEIIVNKPILKGTSGYPDSDGYKAYKFTFIQDTVYDDDYIKISGQGYAGYPLPFGVYQPDQIVRAAKLGQQTVWTRDRQQDRPNYYGLEADSSTKERPTGLWSKGSADNTVVAESYSYVFDGLRQNFTGIPNNRAVELQNYPVQNVFVATNQGDYDLTEYPNSYTIKNFPITNFNGSSYDLVILYGGVGTDPQFSQRPEFIPACKVCMDDAGVIRSVQDTVWVLDNGGYETKTAALPQVSVGLDLIDNGLSVIPENTQYTFTPSSVITGYLEQVDTIYPDNLSVTELWPDGDDRRKGFLSRDGRWYDESGTIPDTDEPNPKHALIPFGEFGVDFLYAYEKSGSFYDYLVVKGSKLYNASELVTGVTIEGIREISQNGYIPVAALVQLGSGDRGFHNIVDIKGKEAGSVINITTEEFLKDLSSKTQFRTERNLLSKVIYNSALQGGDPVGQGWTKSTVSSNILEPVPDPDDGTTTLKMETSNIVDNSIDRILVRSNVEDLYENGGNIPIRVKPSTSVNDVSGEWRFRQVLTDDPRATETFFLFPEANPQIPEVPFATHDTNAPPMTITSTGEVSFKVERVNADTFGTILSGLSNKFSIAQFSGSIFDVFVDGIQVSSGLGWSFNAFDVGKTVTFRRVGNVVQYLVDGVLKASDTAPDADDWVLTTIGAKDLGSGSYEDYLTVMGISDLQIKETSVATPRIYQMATRKSEFSPNVPADGDFIIQNYAPFFWKAKVSGDYPPWDEAKTDYVLNDIVNYAGSIYKLILAAPPVGNPPPSEPTFWEDITDISSTAMYVNWSKDATETTLKLISDTGDSVITFPNQVGYFDIDIDISKTSSGDWGLCNFTVTPPSGAVDSQTISGIDWKYSGFTDESEYSSIDVSNGFEDKQAGRLCFLKLSETAIFRTPPTINLTASDFILNNIYVAEGRRDWTFVLPPFSNQLDEVNSPNASSVNIKFIGRGSFLIKRPDLSDDVVVNNGVSVQGVFDGTSIVDITTEDDRTTLNYTNYTVTDLGGGEGTIIAPTPPTEAINVSWDNTGTSLTSTNVQSMGVELANKTGTESEELTVTASAGVVITLSELTIPTDYLTNSSVVMFFNGEKLQKGVTWSRNSPNSFTLPIYTSKAGKDHIEYFNYPS